MAGDDLTHRLAKFVADPDHAAVITDFDGTLSPIVDDPAAARPLPGAVELLHRLAARYRTVAVVSGRPASFLMRVLELDRRPSTALVAWGLYGLESASTAGVYTLPDADKWRAEIEAAATRADADAPEGVIVERKGLSVTIHVRTAEDKDGWAASWAQTQAAARGLALHPARMSYELRPPLDVDKGTVVSELIAGAAAACFIGDDYGDLPAFDALDRLKAATGADTVRVVATSAEAPPELIERADLVVEGPMGALGALRHLLQPPPAAAI